MNLNGKALELFESYIKLQHGYDLTMTIYLKEVLLNALIIEWLDSEGIYISINREISNENMWSSDLTFKDDLEHIICSSEWLKTRQEALTQAIAKCNEIINLK